MIEMPWNCPRKIGCINAAHEFWMMGKIHGSMKMIHSPDKVRQMEYTHTKDDKWTTCDKWKGNKKNCSYFLNAANYLHIIPFYLCFYFVIFFFFPLTLVWLLIPLLLLLIAIECFNTIQTSKYLVSFMSMSNIMCVLRSSEKWRFAFLSEVRSNSVRQRFSSFDISYGVVSK